MIRQFSVDKPAGEVEDVVNEWYGGENEVIAAEVFDDPSAKFSDRYGCTIGPWVVGPPDEVFAWLEDHSDDYAVQYNYGPPDEMG